MVISGHLNWISKFSLLITCLFSTELTGLGQPNGQMQGAIPSKPGKS